MKTNTSPRQTELLALRILIGVGTAVGMLAWIGFIMFCIGMASGGDGGSSSRPDRTLEMALTVGTPLVLGLLLLASLWSRFPRVMMHVTLGLIGIVCVAILLSGLPIFIYAPALLLFGVWGYYYYRVLWGQEPPTPPTSVQTGSTMVQVDFTCFFCGYNLRGLDPASRCPECGRAIADSLAPERLPLSNPAWVGSLTRGLRLLVAAQIILALDNIGHHVVYSLALSAGAGSALTSPRSAFYDLEFALQMVLLACSLLGLTLEGLAIWRLTPAMPETRILLSRAHQRVLRGVVLIGIFYNASGAIVDGVGGGRGLAGVMSTFIYMGYAIGSLVS